MRERKDIGARLENWGKWANSRTRGGDADCMTGLICESMRRNALGDVWSGHEVRNRIDTADAERIQMGMPKIDQAQRWLLHWCYIRQEPPEKVSRFCHFPVREFKERFYAAQEAIEDAADDGNR